MFTQYHHGNEINKDPESFSFNSSFLAFTFQVVGHTYVDAEVAIYLLYIHSKGNGTFHTIHGY